MEPGTLYLPPLRRTLPTSGRNLPRHKKGSWIDYDTSACEMAAEIALTSRDGASLSMDVLTCLDGVIPFSFF